MLRQQVQDPQILAGSVAEMPRQTTQQTPQPSNTQPVNLSQFQTSPFDPNVQIENNFFRPQNQTTTQQQPVQQQTQTAPQTSPQQQAQPQPKTQPQQQQTQPRQQPQRQQQSQPIQQPKQAEISPRTQQTAQMAIDLIKKAQERGREATPEERQAMIEQLATRRGVSQDISSIMDIVDQQMGVSGMENFTGDAIMKQKEMQRLSQMDSDQMIQMIENGMIKAGQEIELQGMANYQEALAKIKAKQASKNANAIINVENAKKEDNTKTIRTRDVLNDLELADNLPESTMEQVRSLKTDETLNQLSGEIGGLDGEIFELQNKLKNLKKTITAEFPTSISKSALDAIMYDRSIAMNDELEAKLGLRQAKVMDYERIKAEKQEQLRMQIQQQQQTMNFLTANGGVALLGTPTSQLRQMEEQGLLPGGFADLMTNKTSSMTAMTLSALGNVTPEDQKAIQGMLQSGMSPQQVISSLQSTGRFTPQTANAFGFMSLGDGQVAVTNKLTGEVQIMNGREAQQMAVNSGISMQVQNVAQDFLSSEERQPGKTGGQCGVFLNSYLRAVGLEDWRVGNTIEEKEARMNRKKEEGPIDGAIVVMKTQTEAGQQFGHVGLVYRDASGQWRIRDSNWNNDGKVGDRPFDPTSSSILGYQDPNARMNMIKASDFNASDISFFNTLTPTQRAKERQNPQLREFEALKQKFFSDPNADIKEIMLFSQGQKEMGETTVQQLSKVRNALTQVSDIAKKVDEMTTGPIRGRIRNANARDTDAKVLKAQLTSAIPNVARGVYSEVGVLTDSDVELYRQTLPNLTNTQDQNKLITAMTIRSIANNLKNQLQTQARSGRDVSGFVGDYEFIMQEADALLQQIGQGGTQQQTQGQIQVNIPPHLQFLSR